MKYRLFVSTVFLILAITGCSPTVTSNLTGDLTDAEAKTYNETLDDPCANAVGIELEAPEGNKRSRSVFHTSTLLAGSEGSAESKRCTATNGESITGGTEQIYNVSVPAGMYDLVVNTDLEETKGDTVVYVRYDCEDPSSELTCNDNSHEYSEASTAILLSAVGGVEPYTVFVEQRNGDVLTEDLSYGAEFYLRPILFETGAACDPVSVENRCASFACICSRNDDGPCSPEEYVCAESAESVSGL